jgi:hypothetical protein
MAAGFVAGHQMAFLYITNCVYLLISIVSVSVTILSRDETSRELDS